jgi:hypothetical protein
MNRAGQQIDLHWHLLPEGRQPGMDDDVWTRTADIEIGGGKFPGMIATDLLWHVCAHGAVGDQIPAIRWVADAWTILQNRRAGIDWPQFVAAVQRRQLTLAVGRALVFLREEFNAPVPAAVITELRDTPPAWLERWADRIKSRPPGMFGAAAAHGELSPPHPARQFLAAAGRRARFFPARLGRVHPARPAGLCRQKGGEPAGAGKTLNEQSPGLILWIHSQTPAGCPSCC